MVTWNSLFSSLCLREDQNIIQIDKEEFVQHIAENITDECLEHHWGISESERHYLIFEMSDECLEGSLLFVPAADSDEMIGVPEVKLGEGLAFWNGTKAAPSSGGEYLFRTVISLSPR